MYIELIFRNLKIELGLWTWLYL